MLVTQLKENLCLRYQMCKHRHLTTRHQCEYEEVQHRVRRSTTSSPHHTTSMRVHTPHRYYFECDIVLQGDLEDKGRNV